MIVRIEAVLEEKMLLLIVSEKYYGQITI